MARTISIAGTKLELVERGEGRPLLFLHAGEGLMPERPWLDLLEIGRASCRERVLRNV
jgi:hypothetical protein